MAEENVAAEKAAEEKKLAKEEAKREEKEIERQEKAEAKRLADIDKAIADAEAAEEKAAQDEENAHSLIVVDVAAYVGKVSGIKLNGVPRRLAGIRMMFEELGPENYVTTLTYKGTEACIFTKK